MPSGLVTIANYQKIVLACFEKDRLTDAASIAAVAADLDRQLEMCPVKISLIIDLSKVTAMSSQMLGKLVALHKKVKNGKGRMCLTGVCKQIMPLFEITKLTKVFEFKPDAQEVILFYQRKPL
ncbi:MAG: STAS domain-containing protein [Planctomycetota bacterium]|jgi:anti-anti-sigma factor|nr:STAS domain-containing protein [Planctomycetota bacterium]